jgi:hypothetical protein
MSKLLATTFTVLAAAGCAASTPTDPVDDEPPPSSRPIKHVRDAVKSPIVKGFGERRERGPEALAPSSVPIVQGFGERRERGPEALAPSSVPIVKDFAITKPGDPRPGCPPAISGAWPDGDPKSDPGFAPDFPGGPDDLVYYPPTG